jgi:hypothetical protein
MMGVDGWQSSVGAHFQKTGRKTQCIVWLGERPRRLSGAFGMGCKVCATLLDRLQHAPAKDAALARRRWSTKWSRFEITGVASMQAECIKAHAATSLHKTAIRCFLAPDAPVVIAVPDDDDEALTRGHTPQPEHWVRVWAMVKNPTSYSAAARLQATEAFLSGARSPEGVAAASRKALAAMVCVMAEAIRCEKREILRRSTAVCLSLDDRREYRVIRYRCCVEPLADESVRAEANVGVSAPFCAGVSAQPPACAGVSAQSPACAGVSTQAGGAQPAGGPAAHQDRLHIVHEGVLCVLRRGGAPPQDGESLANLPADYSEKMKASILHAVDVFCTPMGAELDTSLRDRIVDHLFTYTSDGGAPVVKCGKLLQTSVPRLVLLIRDTAHQTRTSTIAPLLAAEGFKDFWSQVFDDKGALVPSVQHSDAWREKLEGAQMYMVQEGGQQGGGLRCALRHLSFAKQRWDSAACPARKYCCLLGAIAVLLVCAVVDTRIESRKRRRAEAFLGDMTPERITIAGLFADYTAECLAFVRIFDTAYHDVAQTQRQALAFRKRLRSLFYEGHIFDAVPAGVSGETCTAIAIGQAKEFGRMYYGDRVLELWPRGARSGADRALARLQEVVDAVDARLDAELPACSLLLAFAAFDIRTWQALCVLEAQDNGPAGQARSLLTSLRSRVLRLIKAHPLVSADVAGRVTSDFEAAARALRRRHRSALGAQALVSNLSMWEAVLLGDVPHLTCSPELAKLIQWYLSVTDGSATVERNLGRLTAMLDQHRNLEDGHHATALLEIDLDGPRQESDLVSVVRAEAGSLPCREGLSDSSDKARLALSAPAVVGCFRMTAFTRRCAQLWVAMHQRRFCVYKVKRQKVCTSKPRRTGTDAHVLRGQRQALTALFDASQRPDATPRKTILGVSRTSLLAKAKAKAHACPSPGLSNFRKTTKEKLAEQTQLTARRRLGLSHVQPPLRLGNLFDSHSIGTPLALAGCTCVCVGEALPARRDVLRCSVLGGFVWAAVRDASIVVLENVRDLELTGVASPRHDVALAIIAMGKAVVSRRAFLSSAPLASSIARYKPAVEYPLDIAMTRRFAEKHPRLVGIIRRCGEMSKSKWKAHMLTTESPAHPKGAMRLDSLADMCDFIRKHRRFAKVGGIWPGPDSEGRLAKFARV